MKNDYDKIHDDIRIQRLRVGALYCYRFRQFFWRAIGDWEYMKIPPESFLLYLGTDVPKNIYRDPCFLYGSKIFNIWLPEVLTVMEEVKTDG
jgi:hypothetical protein